MKTLYKSLKCGKEMSGYGQADLDANVFNHEAHCPVCNSTAPEMVQSIIETVDPEDKRIIKDIPKVKKTRGKPKKKESLISKIKKASKKRK